MNELGYKFDKLGICVNPSTSVSHEGKSWRYDVRTAQLDGGQWVSQLRVRLPKTGITTVACNNLGYMAEYPTEHKATKAKLKQLASYCMTRREERDRDAAVEILATLFPTGKSKGNGDTE